MEQGANLNVDRISEKYEDAKLRANFSRDDIAAIMNATTPQAKRPGLTKC